jgi:hypothetical protein
MATVAPQESYGNPAGENFHPKQSAQGFCRRVAGLGGHKKKHRQRLFLITMYYYLG